MTTQPTRKYWVRGDLDGFFGLFIDNLLQLMLIQQLCLICGFPEAMITGKILPGAALSILLGNAFYSYQAWQLMKETGRDDITALPYGINTVSLFAYIFFIMGPVYWTTQDADLAWKMGLVACFISGVMEIAGAFFGDFIRKVTPRAALLSALGGIAITFISMGFIFQIFASPLIAIIPMVFIVTCYATKIKLPYSLPGGLVAVVIGIGLAWGFKSLGWADFKTEQTPWDASFYIPTFSISELISALQNERVWSLMSIIIPMALFNVVGSLQNLESAAAAGDNYKTKPSLIVNGIGTVLASFFCSPFPTTIYIGHPAWKGMGARASYSVLNGIVMALLCTVGAVTLILKFMPMEVSLGILLWIGVIMVTQCFQDTPKNHALAIVVGLIPSLAAWGLILIETALRIAGTNLFNTFTKFNEQQFYISGLIALNQGFLLTSMCLSAMMVFILEKKFIKASLWTLSLALLSLFGLIHAYTLDAGGIHYHIRFLAAPKFALAYLMCTILLWFFAVIEYKNNQSCNSI